MEDGWKGLELLCLLIFMLFRFLLFFLEEGFVGWENERDKFFNIQLGFIVEEDEVFGDFYVWDDFSIVNKGNGIVVVFVVFDKGGLDDEWNLIDVDFFCFSQFNV